MPYVLLLLLLSSGPKLGKGIRRVLWGIGTKNLSKHVVKSTNSIFARLIRGRHIVFKPYESDKCSFALHINVKKTFTDDHLFCKFTIIYSNCTINATDATA